MKPLVRLRSFTLLELLVVVTLLTVAIGTVTLGVTGMSDQNRLRTAASRAGAMYRLAACAATRTGRPRVIEFDRRGLRVKKPVFAEGQWAWSSAPRIDFGARVSLLRVSFAGMEDHPLALEPPWEVAVSPGVLNAGLLLELRLDNGTRGMARINGPTALTDLKLIRDGQP